MSLAGYLGVADCVRAHRVFCSWALGRTLGIQEAIDEWEGRGMVRPGALLSSTLRHVHGVSPLMHTLAYRAQYHLANRHRWDSFAPAAHPLLRLTRRRRGSVPRCFY